MRRLQSAVLVIALLGSACSGARVDLGDLQVVQGLVERLDEEGWEPTTTVADGDRIRAADDARLEQGDERLWLLGGSEVVIDDDTARLVRGDAMVDGGRLRLGTDDAVVTGVGAFRVEAGVTPRVAVYAGNAQVVRPGEGYRLQAYRQLDLTSRRFDGLDDPLAYDAADPWDQRYLAAAINFDDEVGRYAARLGEVYGEALRPPGFYAAFAEVAAEDIGVLTMAAPRRDAQGAVGPPAEALIGLFVTRAATTDGRTEDEAAERVTTLRAEGARWGLIAMALQLGQVVFGATVDRAVAAAEVADVAPAAPAAPPPTSSGPAPAPVAAPPDTAPPPPAAPPPTAPPPPDGGLLGPVIGPVEEILDEVLGGVAAPVGTVLGR